MTYDDAAAVDAQHVLTPVMRVVQKMDDEDVWMRAWEVMVKASSNYYSAKTIEKRADDCLAAFKKRFR